MGRALTPYLHDKFMHPALQDQNMPVMRCIGGYTLNAKRTRRDSRKGCSHSAQSFPQWEQQNQTLSMQLRLAPY